MKDGSMHGGHKRVMAYSAAALALAAVFVSYLNPHLVVDLAARVWACF